MSTAGLSERLAESVGPIVVKEVRQGLRARVFAIFFGTLLVACLSIALIAFADAAESLGRAIGKDFFGAYLAALGAVCFFVIPFVAFRSMLRELEDETWVLLTLTGLGPRSITRGKWLSAMSQAMLFASACAPFVLFTYFLNGIDLLQIVVALVLASVWCSLLTATALAVASQAHSKLGRTFAHFVVLGVLGLGSAGGIAFAFVIAEEGYRLVNNDALRNFAIGAGVFSAFITWLMLESAASGLCLPSENASKGPRFALSAIGLLGIGFGLALFVIQGGRARDAEGGQLVTCFILTLAGPFCVSERDGWPSQTSDGAWLKPGALRSFLLIEGLLIASTLTWGFLFVTARSPGYSEEKAARGLLAALVYPSMYLSLAVLLGRLTPLRRLGEPLATRFGFALSVAMGVVFSMLASLMFDNKPDGRLYNALNPIVGLANFVDRSGEELNAALVFATSVAAVATLAALTTLVARDRVRT